VSGDRIGQAEGIIMERYGVDDVCAFEMLRQLSKEAGVALVDMAQRVVDTRTPRDGEPSAPVTG
jgi:AmiR/NasT family two-component response regulator